MRTIKRFFMIALIAAIFAAGIWFGLTVSRSSKNSSGLHEENTTTVVQQIQTLSDLVTVKYVVEKVEILDDAKWYGENRVLLLGHGIVKAGIDLSKLAPADIMISNKKIFIRLPPPQITDAYLDDKQTQVIDQTTGLFREFDKDLQQTARENAVEDVRRAARINGILNDADSRAKLELSLFLRQAGFSDVEFISGNQKPIFTPEHILQLSTNK